MGYTIKIRNSKNEILQLYPSDDYMLQSITGLTPADAAITTTHAAAQDGERFNTSYVLPRNVVINFRVRGMGNPTRKRRINLYKYIKTKQKVRLFIETDQRDVYIDGYVEKLDDQGTIFSRDERMQLSVICPDPFFHDRAREDVTVSFGAVSSEFHFPVAIANPIPFSVNSVSHSNIINNAGDVECGMILHLQASDTVVSPEISVENGDKMEFDLTMEAGDELTVSTRRGEKSVIFRSNGVNTNAISTLTADSTWLTLDPGETMVYYTAFRNYDKLTMTCTYTILYEGV